MTRPLCSVMLLALFASSCAAAGAPKLVGQPIKKEVAVLVRVSDAAVKTDQLGGIAALVETITDGLNERGIKNQVFAADDDQPPAPRIEIWVEEWDAGSPQGRVGASTAVVIGTRLANAGPGPGLVVYFAGGGDYSVRCKIYRQGDAAPAHDHRYSGRIRQHDGQASVDEGKSVAEDILEDAMNERSRRRRSRER